MIELGYSDKERIVALYSGAYKKYGYSPLALEWTKDKQDVRFDILLSEFAIENKKILDIGCGFGDLNKKLIAENKKYDYTGIDLVPEIVDNGKVIYNHDHVTFICGEFLEYEFKEKFDIIVAAGIFNYKMEIDNYRYVEEVIKKSLTLCNSKGGVAFDFLSDKVNYQLDKNFYNDPCKILSIAYNFSKNIILKNHYMPFEYTLFIFKDDTFDENTLFNRYVISHIKHRKY